LYLYLFKDQCEEGLKNWVETFIACLVWHTKKVKFPQQMTVLNFLILAVSSRTAMFNIQKFYMVLVLCCVFCVDLRTDSGCWFGQH
jgi:predicted membrane-bound dolichyl-phosphate-mannose-protein mannosyltransferase